MTSPARGTVAEWQLRRAFPSKWSGPELNADPVGGGVETLELAHHGLERQDVTMPVHIEEMISEVTVVDGDLPLTERAAGPDR